MSNQSQSNARMTFDQLMELSNPKAKDPKLSPDRAGRSRTVSTDEVANLERRLHRLQVTPIPPMVGKSSQGDIKKMMQPALDIQRIVAIGALPRDQLDSRSTSKKQKQLANFTTNEMLFTHFGKDGAVLAMVKAVDRDRFDDATGFEEYVDAVERSTLSIGSSGTAPGLYRRLVQGITAAPTPRLAVTDYSRYARSVLEYHEVKLDFKGKSLKDMIDEVKLSGDFLFNWKSSAGIPYYKKLKDEGVLPTAMLVGADLLNAFAQGSVAAMHTQRPSLFAVMLKNKQDIYELAKLEEKVRPYFVYPLHERLLYSVVQCKLKARRFDEVPSGSSAVGFSWNYGGGDKLYKWIRGRHDAGPGFYSVFYGDDQLWVIVLSDGSCYVCTPDFSHMDLSLAPIWGNVAFSLWKKAFSSIDKTWESVLKYNCYRAFTRPVVVDGALTYLFKYGLGSGIPGTTKFDEVASASVNGFVKEQFDLVKDRISSKEMLERWLGALTALVKAKFGLVFKDGSMVTYPFSPEEDSYPWVFLGQSLLRVRGRDHPHYIPKPDLAKIVLSATTFKKAYSSVNARQRASASKLRSLFAGGGYLYPQLASAMEKQFEVYSRQGVYPFGVDDGDGYEEETEGDVFFTCEFNGDHWPTEEWALNLYLPPDDQVEDHTGISVSDRLRAISGNELSEFTMDLEGFTSPSDESEAEAQPTELDALLEAALNPQSWGDQDRLERVSGDKGDGPPKNPQEVPVRNQAELQPLPLAAKQAFEKEQEAAREKIKSERPVIQSSARGPKGDKRKPVGRTGNTRSGAAIQEGDYDYLEDPTADDQ